MRILWWGAAPWANTGYGVQARTFVPRIEALGHSLVVLATYGAQGAILPLTSSILVFPSGDAPYAQGMLAACAARAGADVVVGLGDVWPLLTSVLQTVPNWCPWTPVDTTDLPPNTAQRLRLARRAIAMSRHGQAAMARAGIDSAFVPHGYDRASYYPEDQGEARRRLGWDPDRFVATLVGANHLGFAVPNRKCFDEQFRAFAMLQKKHKDAMLYVHSLPRLASEGTDLLALAACRGLDVGRDVHFPDPIDLQLGLPPDYMRLVYSASDVLLSVSAGEGFGVPCIEAQACGCPIIGGDWSATAELVGPGWRVCKSEAHEFYIDLWKSSWHLPRPEAIAERLGAAYDARGDVELRGRAAAFAADYEADHVTATYWKPLLDSLGEREQGGQCAVAAE